VSKLSNNRFMFNGAPPPPPHGLELYTVNKRNYYYKPLGKTGVASLKTVLCVHSLNMFNIYSSKKRRNLRIGSPGFFSRSFLCRSSTKQTRFYIVSEQDSIQTFFPSRKVRFSRARSTRRQFPLRRRAPRV
jgi:hypothetical protein